MSKEATQESIGNLLGESATRDAIHIAVAPMIATENLRPGQHVGLSGDEEHAAAVKDTIGIVDPYLRAPVKPGDRFFLFLYPNTVTGLRHQWQHPAFTGEKAASEKWLRDYAEENYADYNDLLAGATSGDGYTFGMNLDNYPDENHILWTHVENITGKRFSHKHKSGAYFSCSC